MTEHVHEELKTEFQIPFQMPQASNWECYLFGHRPGGLGMVYTPAKGHVPNRFVRFMMRICFDCYWVKKDD